MFVRMPDAEADLNPTLVRPFYICRSASALLKITSSAILFPDRQRTASIHGAMISDHT